MKELIKDSLLSVVCFWAVSIGCIKMGLPQDVSGLFGVAAFCFCFSNSVLWGEDDK